jgi:hypothetical protein
VALASQLLLAEIYTERSVRASAIRLLDEFLARRPASPEAPRVRQRLEQLKSAAPGR